MNAERPYQVKARGRIAFRAKAARLVPDHKTERTGSLDWVVELLPELGKLGFAGIFQLMRNVRRSDGKTLLVVVSPNDRGGKTWSVGALEGESSATAEAFLDDHAHALVGESLGLEAALSAADRYQARWLESGPELAKCGCTEIRKSRPRRRRKAA